MSNQQVGTVFDRVIQEVCEASQVDFEESGVDQPTLEEMRKIWQEKLSSLGVAHFPWDPQPEPPQPPPPTNPVQAPATIAGSAKAPRPAPSPAQQSTSQQQPSAHVTGSIAPAPSNSNINDPGPRIKAESGVNGQSGLTAMGAIPPSASNSQTARERAASNLNYKYGPAAANSVSQLQAQSHAALSLPGQQRPSSVPMPNTQGQDPKLHPGYQNPLLSQRTSLSNSQTDGSGDALAEWKAEVLRRRDAARQQNGDGDRLLREQLRLQQLRLEAGGLMLPLNEHSLSSRANWNASISSAGFSRANDTVSGIDPAIPSSLSNPEMPGSQYDGPSDDVKVDDEDAINSDLDDPDDLVAADHDGEEAVGQVMLCTYDKVQRVKNKWKCTLKDGILTTGGKEYVFNKGQGEFEW